MTGPYSFLAGAVSLAAADAAGEEDACGVDDLPEQAVIITIAMITMNAATPVLRFFPFLVFSIFTRPSPRLFDEFSCRTAEI
jgi:hypothetical protein